MKACQGLLGVLLLATLGGCSSGSGGAPAGDALEPIPVSNPGVSKAYFKVGDYRLAGQPNEEGLDGFQTEGIQTVINLRPDAELKGFDEKSAVESRGMGYVSFPVTPQTLGNEMVAKFLETVKTARKPVVIHCASANRVSGLWALYLVEEKGLAPDAAVALAEKSGLKEGAVKAFVMQYLSAKSKESPAGDSRSEGETELQEKAQ